MQRISSVVIEYNVEDKNIKSTIHDSVLVVVGVRGGGVGGGVRVGFCVDVWDKTILSIFITEIRKISLPDCLDVPEQFIW